MASREKAAMGGFVIGGFLLFAVGLFLIGDRRMLFSDSAEYYTEFAQLSALQAGAKVRVGGMDAGEIVEINVPGGPGSKFRLKFRIIEKMFPVIRTDSVASIQTDGLLGNKFLQIDIGTTGLAPPAYMLPSREPFEIGDLLGRIRDTVTALDDTIDDVKVDVTNATQTVAETATHVDQIIVAAKDDIDRITAAASTITDDVGGIIAGLNAGKGTIGKLLKDDAVYNSVSASVQQVEHLLGNVRQTSEDVKDLVSRFQSGDIPEDFESTMNNVRELSERVKVMVAAFQPAPGGGDGISGDLRATLGSAREAMSGLSENMEALKRSFFFRGFFKDRGFYDLGSLSTAEYRSKEFEKNVQKERTWVQQAELFTVGSDGGEELSVSGKTRLNSAMAKFLQFAEDTAVIVEGYASAGTLDEQFLLSRERAMKVRDYLIGKFGLSAEYVGAMPMGAVIRSSNSSGGFEEGIALVLLKK